EFADGNSLLRHWFTPTLLLVIFVAITLYIRPWDGCSGRHIPDHNYPRGSGHPLQLHRDIAYAFQQEIC
ncbi:zinc transporter ZIP9, partial [Histoplasma capsulatum]